MRRLAGDDYGKRPRHEDAGLAEAEGARRRLINGLLQINGATSSSASAPRRR
jgi:hypothetical protein